MNRKFYIFSILMAFAITSTFAQQQSGPIVLTMFGDSTYTTGMAGEFTGMELKQGQVLNMKGQYGDVATATELNINYTIIAPDWSAPLYADVVVYANDSIGNLDGIIDFDYMIPMDADTAGQHDIDSMTLAYDFIQVRIWHEDAAMIDCFWYEFVNVRTKDPSSTRNVQQLEGVEVYPNPASNEVFIKTQSDTPKKITVYDMVGQRIMNTEISGNRLDVSSLQTGMHTILIRQDNKVGLMKVMIK